MTSIVTAAAGFASAGNLLLFRACGRRVRNSWMSWASLLVGLAACVWFCALIAEAAGMLGEALGVIGDFFRILGGSGGVH